MDFSWSEEQLKLKESVVEFAKNELNGRLHERDHESVFSRENWKKCADFGLLGSFMPEEYGGSNLDIMTTMFMMEGLGYGARDNGLIFSLNAQMWSVQHPILHFGTDEQKSKYLPALCRGDTVGAHGATEPDSGSDTFSMRTRAEAKNGGYVINGTKTLVTNAPACDMAIVFATVDPKLGRWGISAFLVDKGTPGFTVSRNMHKMGLRTSTIGELVLQDCYVPESCRLGPEGVGVSLFNSSMEWERSCILGGHLGAMERQLEDSIRYARQRRQFGQQIGKFQSVSNRIADMKVQLETARLILYKVAWLKSRGKPAEIEAAIAKLYVSESFLESSLAAVRVHGGYGYLTEFGIERDFRDAVGGTLYSGTSDIQRVIISRLLGL